jgi:predicted negative regulator of RcsB-dependent stress response
MNKKGQLCMLFAALCVVALANSVAAGNLQQPVQHAAEKVARFSIKKLSESLYMLDLPYLSQPAAIFKSGSELWIVSKQPLLPSVPSQVKFRTVKFAEGVAIVTNVGANRVQVSYSLKQCAPMQNVLCKQLQDGYHWLLPCPYKSFVIESQGKRFYVFALSEPGLGSCRKLVFENFIQLEAVQGLVFEADSLEAFEHTDGVSVKTSFQEETTESSLPWHFEGNFLNQKRDLEAAILAAPTTEEAYVCTSRLAKLYFSKGQYSEAADVIKNMGSYSEFKNDLNLHFILAASEYILDRAQSAQEMLSSIANKTCSRKLKGEMLLFESFAKNDAKTAELFCSHASSFLKEYHEEVYWKMALGLMEELLEKLDLMQLESLLNQVRLPKSPYGIEGMKYYESMLLNVMGKREDAQLKLAKLARTASETKFKALATLALIEEPQSIIEKLNALKLEPLDVKTANKITLALADLYSGNSIAELRSLMRFKGGNTNVEARVSKVYKKIFLSEINNYSPLQIVAAFREFRNLLPPGELGDQVVLSVTRKLVDLDLLEDAEETLMHQISNRLSGNRKSAASNCLACIMIMDGKPQKALDILNEASLSDASLARHQIRSRLKSVACISLGKCEQALSYLKGDASQDAFMLKKEALFNAQQWQEYASLVGPVVLSATEGKVSRLPNWVIRDAIRLSLSYLMLNSTEKNSFLAERIRKIDAELANDIENLKSVADCEKLAKKAIGSMQGLIQDYCKLSFDEACSTSRIP